MQAAEEGSGKVVSTPPPAPPAVESEAGEVEPVAQEEDFRLSTPRELEYVYEISAEETSPGPEFEEQAEETAFDGLAPLEDVGDEVMAFEVRSSSGNKSVAKKHDPDGTI